MISKIMHRAPGSAVRCPAEGERATVKQKTEKSHSTVLFYQPSIALSTQKKDLWTPCSAAVECPEKEE
jgi:hypothetical protein